MIHEVIVITQNQDQTWQIAPMGIRKPDSNTVILSPFKPSKTLDNVLHSKKAVVNYTDDVRVFAGCLTGHYDWPLISVDNGKRLQHALAHEEIQLEKIIEDELRPQLHCKITLKQIHQPFQGFNRAQFAVIEAAVLISRLHMLPFEEIKSQIDALQVLIDKTAGERELLAWSWVQSKLEEASVTCTSAKSVSFSG